MILGAIADDFTGAGDLAGILADGGLRVALLTDPTDTPPAESDAVVIALKSRSVPPAEAIQASLAALGRLQAFGCRQFYFKYCSTFDSTPAGNIGPVAEALANALDAGGVVVCPAFPANGRTVYQGHLFVGSTLLSESGMATHPLTPMSDSDIRRWLALQTAMPVEHIALTVVHDGHEAVAAALARHAGLVVVDAVEDADLRTIGRAAAAARLVTGGSALALGLIDNYRRDGLLAPAAAGFPGVTGPAIVLAGSCSIMTNAQVDLYRSAHPAIRIDVAALAAGHDPFDEIDAFLAAHGNAAPMAYSTQAGSEARLQGPEVAGLIEALLGRLAMRARSRGVTRIVVAGGESSGAVIEALRPGPLTVGPTIAPGVPVLTAAGIGFALKSGNFGSEDFFAQALSAIGRPA